jgi:hypothetical protein
VNTAIERASSLAAVRPRDRLCGTLRDLRRSHANPCRGNRLIISDERGSFVSLALSFRAAVLSAAG